MRKFITLLLIAGVFSASAASKIKLNTNKGSWDLASSWDLGRIPQNGDTVIVSPKDTLIIDENLNLANFSLHLKVYGALFFQGGGSKLFLAGNSVVTVYTGGSIYSTNSPSQILAIDGITKYSGNGTSIIGPAFASSATSTGFASFMEGPITLPVKFIGFTAVRNNKDVIVQWATAQEVNASLFEVQRSTDGANWNTVGTERASGNTTSITNYSFVDKNVNATTVYYRIKQVDVDNRFEYTAIRTVKANLSGAAVSTVGVKGNIVLQFPEKVKGQVEIRLISLNGQVVSRHLVNQPLGQVIIPVSVKGNYIVSVINQQNIQVNKQILL